MINQQRVVKYDIDLQKLAAPFHSGNNYLDCFLKSPIALDDNYGKTYVLLSGDNKTIIGYYNLGLGYIEQEEYGTVHKIGGAVHINEFALDKNYQGVVQKISDNGQKTKLSDVLLDNCLNRIEHLRKERIGFSFVTLSSTEEGYNLYKRNGFEELDEDMKFSIDEAEEGCKLMYCPIGLLQ